MTRTQKLLGIFAATAICLPALAQNANNSDRYQNRTSQNQAEQNRRDAQNRQSDAQRRNKMQQRSEAMNPSKTITGTIRSMKHFNLTGVNGKRCVARVETKNGDHVAVILGPSTQMRNLDLSQGDQVTLRVKKGSIDDRHVLVADRIRAGNKTHQVENRKVDDLKRISGEIVASRTRTLKARDGYATEHKLIKVQEANGRTCIVSLGPISETDQMRLRNGEEVSVLASPTKVNGHMVYCARRISHDGQVKNLASKRSDTNRRSASRD